ncbi:MAG: U32 family peptidase [Clostridia bacterium]|nr:U32 family peptidase [Clostridia bacterium]
MTELLAPAGSMEALIAAVENGADAVYFGTTLFNARMLAKNFSRDAVREAVTYCHQRGVRCYVTMNTLLGDRMMKDAMNQVEFLYTVGVDALIIADLGLAGEIRRSFPDFPLHASTQCSAHNVDAVRYLKELGFTRAVVARELSREDLETVCKNSPIEIEAFVHGALCVSQSGQCLLSSFIGGRSGNRGECAQPCRMLYNGKYPLSLKDLSLARHMPELIAMGVTSFKIEGRMKSPDYVGKVTRIFRTLIDEERGASDEEMRYLAEVFSRQGFTDGYYTKTVNAAMLGIRTEKDKEASRQLESRPDAPKKTFKKDAIILPPREHSLLPPAKVTPSVKKRAQTSARFYDAATIPDDPRAYGIAIVYLPLDRYNKKANGVVLPPVIFDSERDAVADALKRARAAGAEHALVGNIGHIALAKEAGFVLHGDWRLNIQSGYTAKVFEEDFADLLLSPELILPQIRDIPFAKCVTVYGRQILMTLEKPVGYTTLTDRTKAVFPILKEGGRDILLNSLPTYMADKKAELQKAGDFAYHYLFTTEGKQETLQILNAYQKGWTTKKAVRRIK